MRNSTRKEKKIPIVFAIQEKMAEKFDGGATSAAAALFSQIKVGNLNYAQRKINSLSRRSSSCRPEPELGRARASRCDLMMPRKWPLLQLNHFFDCRLVVRLVSPTTVSISLQLIRKCDTSWLSTNFGCPD